MTNKLLFNLAGKTAFITGSTRGIGEAIARRMAEGGAQVVINGRDPKLTKTIANSIREQGGKVIEAPGDISEKGFIKNTFDTLENDGVYVDILVNNAAYELRKSSLEFTEDDYDGMMSVNLKAAFFLAQRVLIKMKENGWGRILNISSVHERQPTGFSSIYSMTKGGMMMMTRELAFEFSQYGITVNNIAPGAIRTDMNREVLSDPHYEQKVIQKIPARFIGEVDDVAALATFLASEQARYITGASYFIDGGLVM